MTSTCVSCHNGVHFFDISTSTSAPKTVCFVHFDLEMCYVLPSRTLFRHGNFQECSEHGVSCATTACSISSLIWQDGSAPATLGSLLFDPPESQDIGKARCLATFLPIRAPSSSFSWLFLFSDFFTSVSFSSLPLPISALYLSIASEV